MTTFQIVTKTTKTLMSINGIEVVAGQKYDIALQTLLKLENLSAYKGEPFDVFRYKINVDDTSSSNTAIAIVSFATDKVGNPTVVTAVESIQLNSFVYFTDVVDPDNHFDRITITAITGKGAWTYENLPLVVGQVFFYYDLVGKLKFVASTPGVENNYAEINWTTANILGSHPGTNSLVLNSVSDGAELLFNSSSGPSIDGLGVETYTYFVSIEKGKIGANYTLSVDTTNFPEIGGTEKVEFFERAELTSVVVDTLGVTAIDSVLDTAGETTYVIFINRFDITTVERSVLLTLTQVDGAINTINVLHKEITLLIPISSIL